MPAGNGMGPRGMGPMTGRGAGVCAGSGMPGFANPSVGRGFGMGGGRGRGIRCGQGGGRGWRHQFNATGLPGWARNGGAGTVPFERPFAAASTKEQELDMLKRQAEQMGETLTNINKRIQELDGE